MHETVAVCIPTFKRPKSLKRLLDAIAALRTDAHLSVLVADNDAEVHAGFDLVADMAAQYRWPLSAAIVEKRGIAQVRNTLVARALASDAIRGALQRHFGVRLAFQNCHRVAVFPLDPAVGESYDRFTSVRSQVLNQSPEFRDC